MRGTTRSGTTNSGTSDSKYPRLPAAQTTARISTIWSGAGRPAAARAGQPPSCPRPGRGRRAKALSSHRLAPLARRESRTSVRPLRSGSVLAPVRLPPLVWSGLALGATATATVLGVLLLPVLGPLAWAVALLPAAVAVGWASGVRLERAVRAGEATRAAVLTAAPDAVVAVDRAGRVV